MLASEGIIRFYVPDLLWGASFACALTLVQGKRIHIVLLVILLGTLYEVMQHVGYTNGTADYIDIVCYFLGSCIVFLLNKEKRKENEEHK